MSKKKIVSNSSSSDDEDDERMQQFKDSVVTIDTLKACVSVNNSSCSTTSAATKSTDLNKPSLRFTIKDEPNAMGYDSDDLNNFKLTPEFQKFVAKKLQKKLEDSIELIDDISILSSKVKISDQSYNQISLTAQIVCRIDKSPTSTGDENKEMREEKKRKYKEMKSNKVSKKERKQSKEKSNKSESETSSEEGEEDMRCQEAAVEFSTVIASTSIAQHKHYFSVNK